MNTAHAALSSLFPKDWDDFGLLPLTVCFMIGLQFENRAPQSRYRDILDVLTVLTYLATLTPLEKKSLKHLTLKLILLLLLDTGQRCYEPHRFIIHISTYKSTKTNTPRCPGSPIVIQELKPDLQLCPLHTLRV